MRRGDNAQRRTDENLQQHTANRNDQRVFHALHQAVDYGRAVHIARAQIEPQENIAQIAPKAHDIRVVQPQLLAFGLDLNLRRPRAQHRRRRVSGTDIHDGKNQDGNPQHNRDHPQQTLENISSHVALSSFFCRYAGSC